MGETSFCRLIGRNFPPDNIGRYENATLNRSYEIRYVFDSVLFDPQVMTVLFDPQVMKQH